MEKQINGLIFILYATLILFAMIVGVKLNEYRDQMQDLRNRIEDLESPKTYLLPFPEGDYQQENE